MTSRVVVLLSPLTLKGYRSYSGAIFCGSSRGGSAGENMRRYQLR